MTRPVRAVAATIARGDTSGLCRATFARGDVPAPSPHPAHAATRPRRRRDPRLRRRLHWKRKVDPGLDLFRVGDSFALVAGEGDFLNQIFRACAFGPRSDCGAGGGAGGASAPAKAVSGGAAPVAAKAGGATPVAAKALSGGAAPDRPEVASGGAAPAAKVASGGAAPAARGAAVGNVAPSKAAAAAEEAVRKADARRDAALGVGVDPMFDDPY